MYRDSAYCVVVPGDSLITPRIFSYLQAGCVPIFPYPRQLLPRILPLPRSIPWDELSLTLDLDLIANWSRHGHPSDHKPLRTALAADTPRFASPSHAQREQTEVIREPHGRLQPLCDQSHRARGGACRLRE